MASKRAFGYIFIGLSVILFISILGQITTLYGAVFGFFKIFTGTLSNYEVGRVVGTFLFWALYFFVTILLWNYGRKWVKKHATP